MSYSHSAQGGSASVSPPRDFKQQQQQQQQDYLLQQHRHHQAREAALPSSNSHPPNRVAKRISHRPASSVYSQASSVDPSFHTQQPAPLQQYQTQQTHHAQHAHQPPYPPANRYDRQDQYSEPSYGYSYTDPRAQYQKYSNGQHQTNEDGVSPESSPELYPHGTYSSQQYDPSPYYREPSPFDMSATQAVPPMDSAADGRPPSASRTSIPSMRRERRQTQEAAVRTLRETKSRERLQQIQERTSSMSSAASKRGYKGGEVRWDPQTGELTSSQKGRPSQVKPIEYARGLAVPDVPGSPTESVHKDPKAEVASFASRLKKTVKGLGSNSAGPASPDPPVPVALRSVSATAAPPSSLPVATSAHAPAPASDSAHRLRDATDPAADAFTSSRPAWHGASGRTTLVAPVHDTPDVAPLNIPRRSSKRVGSVPQLEKAMNAARAASAANAAIASSPSQNSGSLVSPPVSPSPQGAETQGQQSTLRKATATSGHFSAQTPPAQTTAKTPFASTAQSYPSPPLQDQQLSSKIRRKPTPSHQALASFDASDPFNYNNRTNPTFAASPPELRPPIQESDEWTQPTSRFSVTTYNSTIHESQSEFDPYDAPEMPAIPDALRSNPAFTIKRRPTGQADSSPVSDLTSSPPRHRPVPIITRPVTSEGDSVMDRRRPPRLGHSPKTPGNEPVLISLNTPWMTGDYTPVRDRPSTADYLSSGGEDTDGGNTSLYSQLRNKSLMSGSAGLDNSDRASIAGSIHKNLPPAPPETSAKDRVAMLNAQLSGLTQRRINIGRSIKQMTELMPTDNLLATPDVLQKREMEKRKVEGLRTELAEIQREQYEIGLKLHRAYKRLDKNAEYEPTTLWVRRVTG